MKNTSKRHKPVTSPPVYSFYRSNRQSQVKRIPSDHQHKGRFGLKLFSLVVLVVVIWALYTGFKTKTAQAPPAKSVTAINPVVIHPVISKPQPVVSVSPCASNSLPQLILVSISQRHLWACSGADQSYDSPVVTGMDFLPADLTPVGTYHIYAKQTDTYLKGSDSTGSWDDFVYYWLPFLSNQYGIYGIHDATWRPANAFGNISPDSTNASHGCVESPLATAKWLYDWAQIGTTVTIES